MIKGYCGRNKERDDNYCQTLFLCLFYFLFGFVFFLLPNSQNKKHKSKEKMKLAKTKKKQKSLGKKLLLGSKAPEGKPITNSF